MMARMPAKSRFWVLAKIGGRSKSNLPVSGSRVTADAVAFQDDLGEIREQRTSPYFILAFRAMTFVFLAILLTSMLVDVDVVVVGRGTLTADKPIIVLQPLERSLVLDLRVKAGDRVAAGQVLATLDPTFAQADVRQLLVRQRTFAAQLTRMESEISDVDFKPPTPIDDDMQLQVNIYRQRQLKYRERLLKFDEESKIIQVGITATEEKRKSLTGLLEVGRSVEKMRSDLVEDKVGSRLALLDAQSARLRTERELQEATNRLEALRHDLKAKEAERQVFIADWQREAMESFVATRIESAKIAESLSKASRREDLVQLSAPEDGTVLEVAKRSVGSVLQEAEALITIVPFNAKLEAEIMISSTDVGYVRVGDEVAVKVDAFPYQRHGVLKGRLQSIAEDSIAGGGGDLAGAAPPGEAYHRGRIQFDNAELKDLPEGARPYPGMTLSAEIKVGERSVISYFVAPVARSLSDSLNKK